MPFPISRERLNFAELCTPVYEEYFCEVLQEIASIADGQGCSDTLLKAVLFSIYCIMPSTYSSCFVAKSEDNSLILGRNSDFITEIEELYMNTIYKFSGSSYSFNGNTTAFVEIEDGINEHGFAIGLTAVMPKKIQPGIDSGMLLRMGLEKCKTVDEFIDIMQTVPRACSQTFAVADSFGNGALIESSSDKINIVKIHSDTNFVCSTNMFNTPGMLSSNNLPGDTWKAEERYNTLESYLKVNAGRLDIEMAKELLSGKHGFICQYDRATGKDTV